MENLTCIADKLLWFLGGLVVVLVVSCVVVLWCCPDKNCVVSWLQIVVEFWGFIAAIVTFLAAWIDANRKPKLKLYVFDEKHPDREVSEIAIDRTSNARITLQILLENASPEPARFPKVTVTLKFLEDNLLSQPWVTQWVDLVCFDDPMPFGDFASREPSPEGSLGNRLCILAGGDDVIIYGNSSPQKVLECSLVIDPPHEGMRDQLAEYDFNELHYRLYFDVYTNKTTTKGPRIPLTFHLPPPPN